MSHTVVVKACHESTSRYFRPTSNRITKDLCCHETKDIQPPRHMDGDIGNALDEGA